MNEERLTRRSIIIIMAAGIITGVIALLATMFVVGSVGPAYRAEGLVALVPAKQLPADQQPAYLEAVSGGQAARVAAEVFQQPRFAEEAAKAAGVPVQSLEVTAAPVETSQLIAITVTAPSAAAAETAVKTIIATGTPVVQQISGPYDLPIVQDPTGTAVPAGVSGTQLLIVAFIGGLLVGSGAALIIARARTRGDDEPEYFDSGEFRAVQGGYGRPGPPPARQMPGPPGNGVNGGPYGPPRRPVGDPRAQQQPPR
ncbi:MAG: hypothetical protein L0H84_12835 [Pseudonocardia sp.]|nr:hypothetical protein [Pseudonocardia sp.]